jgi:hypothetical protein
LTGRIQNGEICALEIEADRYVIDDLTGGEYTAVTSGYPPTVSTLDIGGWERTVRHDAELRRAWADAGSQDRHGQLACPGRHQRLARRGESDVGGQGRRR